MDHEIRVVLSVLDRLIDDDPESTQDLLPTRAESVRSYRQCVQRDLENLLNAHNTFFDMPPEYVEATSSVLTYGLPDVNQFAPATDRGQSRLRQLLERVIRTSSG